jgi:hypothetical protein
MRDFKALSICPSSTMAALLSALAVLSVVNAQAFDSGNRGEDAFSWVQPLNTTILDEYNSSPPVFPSRKCSSRVSLRRLIEHYSNMA